MALSSSGFNLVRRKEGEHDIPPRHELSPKSIPTSRPLVTCGASHPRGGMLARLMERLATPAGRLGVWVRDFKTGFHQAFDIIDFYASEI
jgi:hypothetical protein